MTSVDIYSLYTEQTAINFHTSITVMHTSNYIQALESSFSIHNISHTCSFCCPQDESTELPSTPIPHCTSRK